MKNIIYLILFVSITAICSCDQQKKTLHTKETFKDSLDVFVNSIVTQFDIPGVAVSVVKDSSICFHNAYGFKNLETNEKLSTENLFHFASISKTLVATAIIQLVEKKQLDINNKIIDHLPYFKMNDSRFRKITIKHILTHTSGIGDISNYEWDNPKLDDNAIENYVKSLENEKLLFEPGTDWSYSNIGFNILGDLISKVSGIPFEEYMETNILNPLGMGNSTFSYPEVPINLRTTPHTWNGQKTISKIYPYNRTHAASGTLNSSIIEMSNYAISYLNQGKYRNIEIFNNNSLDKLWTKSIELENKPEIALSWFIGKHKNLKSIWHGGRDLGFTSYIVFIPERKIAVIVASNYQLSPIDWIANGVLDITLGHKPQTYKHHVGFQLFETYISKGEEKAIDFYHSVLEDSLKAQKYILGTDGIIPVANFVKNNTSIETAKILNQLNIRLHPNSVDALNNLGQVYIELDSFSQASSIFKKVLTLDSLNSYATKKLTEINENK